MSSRPSISPIDLSLLRLFNQQVIESKFTTVKEVVGWMGAMQAQDFYMVRWAIGMRIPNSTNQFIESAIDDGHVIRTHLLRPTWHLASSDDLHWMLALNAKQIKASMKSRDRELELDDVIYAKSNSIFESALQGGNQLSREELLSRLAGENIATDNNRASHLLMRAELDGIICSGRIKKNKQTYALLSERVPKATTLSRDEAISLLALKYFTSHSPATLSDFVWWSGLSVNEARKALEMVKSNFISETIGDQIYWFTPSFIFPKSHKDIVHLLPAFDEFLISYKDRTASLPFKDQTKAVSNNGIFKPIIVINGQVVGIWRRTIKNDRIILETEPFQSLTVAAKEQIAEAALRYSNFLNKKVEIIHH